MHKNVDRIPSDNWVIHGPDGAAVRLGLKRTTLAYRIQKLGISCVTEQLNQAAQETDLRAMLMILLLVKAPLRRC
jgi:hypothetical protein